MSPIIIMMMMIWWLLLIESRISRCGDYLSQLDDFTCVEEEALYEDSRGEFFKVTNSFEELTMRVGNETEVSMADHLGSQLLDEVKGIVTYDMTIHDKEQGKVIDVFADCVDTLTLEATLLTNRNFFQDEHSLLTFFVELLKTVTEVHRLFLVLSNMTMDRVLISKAGTPLILDISQYIRLENKRAVALPFNEYMSLQEYVDKQSHRPHKYTGWEDYFAVGVMLYYTVYLQFPFNPADIVNVRQYNAVSIRYETGTNLLTLELMKALLATYTNRFQLNDIRRFIDNFDQVHSRYFNVSQNSASSVGINTHLDSHFSHKFIHPTVQHQVGMQHYSDHQIAQLPNNKLHHNQLNHAIHNAQLKEVLTNQHLLKSAPVLLISVGIILLAFV